MQLDMHFYGIYALARAAGIKPDSACTIAYASQFVDDALDGEVNILSNKQAVYPIITSHIAMDYKNSILPGLHRKSHLPHFGQAVNSMLRQVQ